jgi:hypothetical protein
VERFSTEHQILRCSKNLSGSILTKEKIAKRKYRFMVARRRRLLATSPMAT